MMRPLLSASGFAVLAAASMTSCGRFVPRGSDQHTDSSPAAEATDTAAEPVTAARQRLAEAKRAADANKLRLDVNLIVRLARVDVALMGLTSASSPAAVSLIKEANAVAADIEEFTQRHLALREEKARKQEADAAEKHRKDEEQAAILRATQSCSGDLTSCDSACSQDPKADVCLGVVVLLFAGQDVHRDRKKARLTAARSCDAGLVAACTFPARFEAIEVDEQKAATAEKQLPMLLATCAKYRDQISVMKRNRDYDGLKKLEPAWSENLENLRISIELVTHNEGDRYVELLRRVKVCTGSR